MMDVNCCKISICPRKEETDMSVIDNSPITGTCSSGIVVEFESSDFSISVKKGDTVTIGKKLGKVHGKDVLSIKDFEITEIGGNYIIGKYSTENAVGISDSYIREASDERIDKISSLLKEYSDTCSFIKDFILRFRFADIASNSVDNSSIFNSTPSYSTDKICKDYGKECDDIIDEYNETMKTLCGRENIESACSDGNTGSLAKSIYSSTDICFNKIFKKYEKSKDYKKCRGSISDFMMCSRYYEYMSRKEFYEYSDNPYVIKLKKAILGFISSRASIEINERSLSGLISNFNIKCNDILGEYWNIRKKDYYSEIKKNVIGESMSATVLSSGIEDSVKSFISSVIDEHHIIGYSADEYGISEISSMFSNLLNIENAVESGTRYNEYIDKNDLCNIFTLKNISQENYVEDYVEGSNNPMYADNEKILKKYIGMLKSVTDEESLILREISDSAIAWYKQNSKSIENGSIFDCFDESEWPSPSLISVNGIKHDFYYIRGLKDEDGSTSTEHKKDDEYGINSIKYWNRYMTSATLAGCTLPQYYQTGIIIAGKRIKLPTIYIPIKIISGQMTTVIGIGLCGIIPMPMILTVNMENTPSMIIPSIGKMIYGIKEKCKSILSSSIFKCIEGIKAKALECDSQINEFESNESEIIKQMEKIEANVTVDNRITYGVLEKSGFDGTVHKKRNGI